MLKGKIAVITGGTRGIGYATVKKFLENGATVVLFGSRQETADKAVASLKAENPAWEVSGAWPNLLDAAEIAKEIEKIKEKYGRIDILVNNAGVSDSKPLDDYTSEHFTKIMQLNVNAIMNGIMAVEKIMKEQGGGCILNTSSMAGINGAMANIGYTSSKFAVEGLTLGMARELGKYNIRVNAVAPAGMEKTDVNGNIIPMDTSAYANMSPETIAKLQKATETALKFAPMGKFNCHPDEMINAFIFLASDAAAFISGQTIAVSGACIWPAASPASSMN